MQKKTLIGVSVTAIFATLIGFIIYYTNFFRREYAFNTVEISATELRSRQPGITQMSGYAMRNSAGTLGLGLQINNRDEGTAGRLLVNNAQLVYLRFLTLPTSRFPVSRLHIQRLLGINNAAYFLLTPVYYPIDNRYWSYRITVLDAQRGIITVPGNPGYLTLNPSPPATARGYEEMLDIRQ